MAVGAPALEDAAGGSTATVLKASSSRVVLVSARSLRNSVDQITQGLDGREANQGLRFLGVVQDGKFRRLPARRRWQSRREIGNRVESDRPQFGELMSSRFCLGEERGIRHQA